MDPKVQLIFPEGLVFPDVLKDNGYDVIHWNKTDNNIVFSEADLHAVFIDSKPWMKDVLIKAIINSSSTSSQTVFPINKLLLYGTSNYPETNQIDQEAINQQPNLGLLFDAFSIHYEKLPDSLEIMRSQINALLNNGQDDHWEDNIKRVMQQLNGTPLDNWNIFNNFSITDKRRKEEHDTNDDISKIIPFQIDIDSYYLAIAKKYKKDSFKYLVIDDHPDKITNPLLGIFSLTGDMFYLSKESNSWNTFYKQLSDNNPDIKITNDIFIEISKDPETKPFGEIGLVDIDAVLVDLLLGDKTTGEDIIRLFYDFYPTMPVFIITRSEEPEILVKCLKNKGADRFIQKRRLNRLPWVMNDYMNNISPFIQLFYRQRNPDLAKRLVKIYRCWTTNPGILWHGEKTFHAAEHTLEHHNNLWKLANQLLGDNWHKINQYRINNRKPKYSNNDLFRFLSAIWLHDIGCKGNERYQMADQVRSRHSWISGDLIHRNPEEYLLERGEEADIVELLCAYHQSCVPFDDMKQCKETVKGLFQQTLIEIEDKSNWKCLMEFASLLRFLDAAEHNWRRVGNRQLYESKRNAIDIDHKYYSEKARTSRDAEDYANWLKEQDKHMLKHRSVLDLNIKSINYNGYVIFWLEYHFASDIDARNYLGDIGIYVLQEWWDTGHYFDERMHLKLLSVNDLFELQKLNLFSLPKTDSIYALYDIPILKELWKSVFVNKEDEKNNREEIKKFAYNIWAGERANPTS